MARADPSPVPSDVASHRLRTQLLNDLISDEMADGARIEHRDTTTAVLVRGKERVLVIVDAAGTVHAERLGGGSRARSPVVALLGLAVLAVIAIVAVVVLLDLL